MMSDFDWGHDLSFELFGAGRWHVVFDALDGDLAASPLAFENLGGMAEANFFEKL
jgi:hypothetical protein